MAIIKLIKKPIEEVTKKGLDKIFKKVYSGVDKSPFKEVDNLGSPPLFRNIKDAPGTEIKKLKKAGEKITKEFRKQDKEKPLKELQKGGTKMGTSFKSGGRVCKIAKKGFGRAYGKNS